VSVLVAILILILLAGVIAIVIAPLRGSHAAAEPGLAERAALEAAREAKYHEIRDAELDFRTGKLSREDYELLSSSLRAEAVEILDRIAVLDGAEPPLASSEEQR
jgi:type II secretory pathway component PulM